MWGRLPSVALCVVLVAAGCAGQRGGGGTVVGGGALLHTVGRGETLWRIGRAYGISVDDLAKANGIRDPRVVQAGRVLRIPHVTMAQPVVPLFQRRPWSHIVVHHSATRQGSASSLAALHRRRGFTKGLGYHFVIDNGTAGRGDGQLEIGPRWLKQLDGAHCNAAGMNQRGIGICLVGNFSGDQRVSARQLDTLVALVHTLCRYYGIAPRRVVRHGDVPGKATECPGLRFPWATFRERLEAVWRAPGEAPLSLATRVVAR